MADETPKIEIVKVGDEPKRAEPLEDDAPGPEVGQWYWFEEEGRNGNQVTWFACIVRVGSNYVKFETPGGSTTRIHFDEFDKRCRLEPNPDAHIDERIKHYQDKTNQLMGRVKEVTARLGVSPARGELLSGNETAALARINSGQNFDTYSTDLVKAKEDLLPDLFGKIKDSNKKMAIWMTAKVVPLKAQAQGLKGIIGKIEDRIFSVELYAGLTERVELIADGEPAELGAKIHLIQRRCYMDEECLAQYETGGMDYKDIADFDRWLTRPDNLNRLLPFDRCVVAFRVRRNIKEREAVNLSDFLRILQERRADEWTFLYLRNGEKVYRMDTKIEFGAKLFPDLDKSKLDGQQLWAKESFREWTIITDNEYQGKCEEYDREKAEWKAKRKAYEAALKSPEAKKRAKELGKKKPDAECVSVPYVSDWWHRDDPRKESWEKYTPESVFYDDITATIEAEIKQHNRVALILQGLLDRSPVFHPHPPWEIWTSDGFRAALELVYDESRALVAGEKPDFEAFRKKLNASLKEGSVTVGQDDAWERYEGAKESQRRHNDYRYRGDWYPDRYRPTGNPGPGTLAKVASFSPKSGRCTYAWNRERQDFRSNNYGEPLRTTYTCSSDVVLNVDAYKPGDFKQFFNDPRTRAEYLKWAPLLLEAEEYHAGHREVSEPVPPAPKKPSSIDAQIRYERRKERKALMGKAVRLKGDVTMRSKTVYKKGTLWRITGGSGSDFSVSGINADGTFDKKRRFIQNLSRWEFEVDESIPPAKDGDLE